MRQKQQEKTARRQVSGCWREDAHEDPEPCYNVPIDDIDIIRQALRAARNHAAS